MLLLVLDLAPELLDVVVYCLLIRGVCRSVFDIAVHVLHGTSMRGFLLPHLLLQMIDLFPLLFYQFGLLHDRFGMLGRHLDLVLLALVVLPIHLLPRLIGLLRNRRLPSSLHAFSINLPIFIRLILGGLCIFSAFLFSLNSISILIYINLIGFRHFLHNLTLKSFSEHHV